METTTPGDLPAEWRSRARLLREWGAAGDAPRVWELAATELEQAQRSARDESLSLVEAARVSGYSADHLGDLVPPDASAPGTTGGRGSNIGSGTAAGGTSQGR